MPKETFYNLSAEKQQTIFQAAVTEFAEHRFSEASINQIIKNAGIPRGSFYQYFKDKEDLYLYVIAEIGKEKLEVLTKAGLLEAKTDFFETYLGMFHTAWIWAQTKPEYNSIGMLMELDSSDFISKLRELSEQGFSMIKGLIDRDKTRGLIKEEVDSELLVEIFYILMMNILLKMYRLGQYDEMLPKAEKIVAILKNGIAVRPS